MIRFHKARLFAGTATIVCASAFAATGPARAACTTNTVIVTCADANTVADVNNAVAAVTPPAVSLVIASGATVTGPFGTIFASNPPFVGAIAFTNAGAIGVAGGNVDFDYTGSPGTAANSFAFANSGTIIGRVSAFDLGGPITATNDGTITDGLTLTGSGAIDLTSAGTIYTSLFAFNAVELDSSRSITATADGVQSTTISGGAATAVISGTVAAPAAGTTPARPQRVSVRGFGGATATVSGITGQLDVSSQYFQSDFTPFGVDSPAGTTIRNDSRVLGGNALATVTEAGRVASVSATAAGDARIVVAGRVGSEISSGFVSANTTGSNSRSNLVTSDATANGVTTFTNANTTSNTPTGGAASVAIGATGQVFGGAFATSNRGDAAVTVAGSVGAGNGSAITTRGDVSATSIGTSQTTASTNVSATDSSFNTTSTDTRAATGGAAAITVAPGGNVFGSVTANGLTSAAIDNAGRIRRDASAFSVQDVTTSQTSRSSRTITPGTGGMSTVVQSSGFSSVNTASGGPASLNNRADGVVEGLVNLNGIGGATLTNAGAVFGNIFLTSSSTSSDSAETFLTTSVFNPRPGGGTVLASRVTANTSTSTSTPVGGAVSGTYSGTVGAVAGSTLAGPRFVQQNGLTASTATIAGTMFADFNGFSGGSATTSASTSGSTFVVQPATGAVSGAVERTTSSSSRATGTPVVSASSLTVTGAVRNNGFGTGDVSTSAGGGNAGVTITGGQVEGGAGAFAAGNSTTASGSDSAARFTTAEGPSPEVQQSQANSSFNESRGVAGVATVAIDNGRVGGNVTANGRGAGPATTGASVTVSATDTVGGSIFASSNTGLDSRTETSAAITRTSPTAVTRVDTSRSTFSLSPSAGGVTVTNAGRVAGSISSSAATGAALVTLTGQALSGVTVTSSGAVSDNRTENRYTGTNFGGGSAATLTSSSRTFTSTATGGTATLTVASSDALRAANSPAVMNGTIQVAGLTGSTLTTTAGSRLLTGGGNIFVGQNFFNTTLATVPAGTGSTTTTANTVVGGPAVMTNAGIVGQATFGFFSAPVFASISSVGGATLTNEGSIYGSIDARALGENSTTTTVVTQAADPVVRRAVTTAVITPVGGAATVTNNRVISGSVSVAGATGTLTNAGVIRGGAILGSGARNYTSTTTATATSANTAAAVLPTALFAQNYTLNQNALLIGGVSVQGATVFDPATVPAGGVSAAIRTSDITAVINLNNGSVTLGNITAQQVPVTAVTGAGNRLTATTLNLNGAGFLGVGTFDLPGTDDFDDDDEGGVVDVGGGVVTVPGNPGARYVSTPAFAAFRAIDPALGTIDARGEFQPSEFLSSGTRITGVETVTKTGTGIFTIVGAPYELNAAGTPPAPVYTMDVGTFRISAGEVQLGVAGTDNSGQRIFGIKGNVENNASLVLGRRITDGSRQVIEGTNVLIAGDYTNGTTGTLAVTAVPTLIRQAGTPINTTAASDVFGFGTFGVTLTPFVPVASGGASLSSTPGSLTVSGKTTIGGTVVVNATPGAIYQAGRNADLIDTGGAFASTATLTTSFDSPFLKFALTPRVVSGRTIVSLDVVRTAYATAAAGANAAAAAGGLEAAIPGVISRISTATATNIAGGVQSYGQAQDLATIISALDTQLTAAQAGQAFDQLASGSFYGSLSALSPTRAFGEATDGLGSTGDAGVGLWLRPTGSFARFDGAAGSGAARLKSNSYGGSIGVNIVSGADGDFGVAAGYSHLKAHDAGSPERATAGTYMVGVYGAQAFDALRLSGQAVFGWSNWDASRDLALFSRKATSSFDSKEFRLTGRVAYDFALKNVTLSPFAKVELRRATFDAFAEDGAGGIGLAVDKRTKSIVSPEIGGRIAGEIGAVRPFAEASYTFQGDVGSDRTLRFAGSADTPFTVRGVDPKGFFKAGAGLAAGVGPATMFLRGDYAKGGRQSAGEIRGGLLIAF